MRITTFTVLLISFISTGQVKDSCYRYFDPYAYGVGESISFSDSTFHYEFVQGLINGSVRGIYHLSGDTITLNSDYQQDDYQFTQVYDPSLALKTIKIKSIAFSNEVEVRLHYNEDSIIKLSGKIISHSRKHGFDENTDTILQVFEVPISNEMKEIEVKVWRTNSTITIPASEDLNSYFIDLTSYPLEMDYVFFKDQKIVLKENNLVFLTDRNKPVKRHFLIVTRRGIKFSKRKRIKKYVRCT